MASPLIKNLYLGAVVYHTTFNHPVRLNGKRNV